MSPLSGKLWPAHPQPLPDELLSSWLVRIACANGLKLQTFCDGVFGKDYQLWNRDIDRLARGQFLRALSHHSGTPMQRVRDTTLAIYSDRLYRKGAASGQLRWILPLGIYHRKRRRFGTQFCPQCLSDDSKPYFRTRWRVAVLTFCPEHRLALHDCCPACSAPVVYHRRELGRPGIAEAGPLCLCHACGFDLRVAEALPFRPYNREIGTVLDQVALHVAGRPATIDMPHLDVLHQLCKVMVSPRKSANLATYVTRYATGVVIRSVPRGRQAFESRWIADRDHIVQLAAWLLAAPQVRLPAAWRLKAMRYSDLVRDFSEAPDWYRAIIAPLNRSLWRRCARAGSECEQRQHR